MAKQAFLEIDIRAAAIAGAVIGFFWWLFAAPFGMAGTGFGTYGFMGEMMGYAYSGLGFVGVLLGAVIGGIAGALVAVLYNWALRLK